MSAHVGHGASVRIEACGKTFADGTRALEPCDARYRAGETLVLLGPSGCGKTTMLRIIAGLEAPDAGGRVLFDGEDMTRGADRAAQCRHGVPVLRAVSQHDRVADNIGYGLKIRGVPAEERAGARRRTGGADRYRGSGEPPHRPAFGRATPARRAGARGCGAPARAAARRAADGARRRRCATGCAANSTPAALARHHHDLRDARSGRGDGARRSYRRHEQGARSPRSARRARSISRRRTASSPNSSAPPILSKRRCEWRASLHVAGRAAADCRDADMPAGGCDDPAGNDSRDGAGSAPALAALIETVSFIGDRQRLVDQSEHRSGTLTVDAPNTVEAKPGERIGLIDFAGRVRLLPPRLRKSMSPKPVHHRADFRPAYQAAGSLAYGVVDTAEALSTLRRSAERFEPGARSCGDLRRSRRHADGRGIRSISSGCWRRSNSRSPAFPAITIRAS